ncbi:MAG: redoxin domain-containing protein [Deltaproteobacteria bacterium]|nr:redoxin domain-containing protein [Deltaproteobacteria bacterium]
MDRAVLSMTVMAILGACDGGGGTGRGADAMPDLAWDWGWGTLDSRGTPGDGTSRPDDLSTDQPAGDAAAPREVASGMPLEVGDPVPGFTLPAHTGAEVSLESFTPEKIVVLSFFPTAAQGLSQQQCEDLEARYADIRSLGAFPFGVSMEDVLTLSHWAADLGLSSLPLLSDAGGQVGGLFGVENDGSRYLQRGYAVIAADGTLAALLLYDAKEPAPVLDLMAALQ